MGEGIPLTVPALTRAYRLGERAARDRFDWPDTDSIFEKLVEEKNELKAEMALFKKAGNEVDREKLRRRMEEELGDMLFVITNLGRHLGVDPELALNGCCKRFTQRFDRMKQSLSALKRSISSMSAEEMDDEWRKAKKEIG